jgi:hypothetical protein
MFGAATGGMPLGMYMSLQKDYPGGKSLKGMLALAQQQFQEDQRLFDESQRAEGEAGSVQYAYTDPYFEATALEEEEAPAPEQKFGFGFGRIYGGAGMKNPLPGSPGYKSFMQQQQYNQTTGGDPEFQAWLASKYGQQS